MNLPWPEVALGDITELLGGRARVPNDMARAPSLTFKGLKSTGEKEFGEVVDAAEATETGMTLLRPGDTVGTNQGHASGWILKKVGFIESHESPAFAASTLQVFRPLPDRVDSRYLFQYLRWPATYRLVTELAGPRNSFTSKMFRGVPVPLPPIDEQRRIASILDAADALRTKRRQALEKLDTLTQSVFMDMFGDPVFNPKGWPSQSLANVVQSNGVVKAGPFGSSLLKSDYSESGYRVYGQEQVIAGRFDVGNYFIPRRKYEQLSACAVAAGDILISLVGSYGKVLVVPPDTPAGIINPRLLRIRPDQNRVRPTYLASLLETSAVQRFLRGAAHGGTMGVLNAALVKSVPVSIPPIGMQMEFEQRLCALKELSVLGRSSESVLDEAFSSLQHRAFRSEL